MGISVATTRVACNTGTGTQDITVSGFGTPAAAIFILTRSTTDGTAADGAVISFGFATGASNESVIGFEEEHAQASSDPGSIASATDSIRVLDGTGANTSEGIAEFSAWITDGVRINWTDAVPGAYLLTVVLFGGTDLSAYVGTQALGTGTSAIDITAPGWEPDVVFTAANVANALTLGLVHNNRSGTVTSRSLCSVVRSGRPTMENNISMREDSGLHEISSAGTDLWKLTFSDFDSSGFSVTPSASTSSKTMYYLALRFGTSPAVTSKVYTFSTPTGTGSANDTGAGFTPQFVFYLPNLCEAASTIYTDANAYSCGVITATSAAQYCMTVSGEDNAADSNTQCLSNDQLVDLPLSTGSAGMAATFTTFISTGVTINWSDIESAAKKWPALAIQAYSTTVTLKTAALTATGIALDVVPGAKTTVLDPAALTATGIKLAVSAPVPGATVTLDTAVLTATAVALDVVPGAKTTGLDTAALTATGVPLDVVPGAKTVTLSTATLTATGVALDVVPGAKATTLDTAALTATGVACSVSATGGTQAVTLDTAALTAAGVPLDVVPGAKAITLGTATLTATGVALTVVEGATTITLSTAALTAAPVALDVVPGAKAIALGTAALTAAPVNCSISALSPGTIGLTTATLTATAVAFDVVPGAISIGLDTAALTATGVSIAHPWRSIPLDSAALTATGVALDVVPGAIAIRLDTAALTAAPVPAVLAPAGMVDLTVPPYSTALTVPAYPTGLTVVAYPGVYKPP